MQKLSWVKQKETTFKSHYVAETTDIRYEIILLTNGYSVSAETWEGLWKYLGLFSTLAYAKEVCRMFNNRFILFGNNLFVDEDWNM